jgi:hypothetical protein
MKKENYDIIVATPTNLGTSIYNQYSICHNIEDLNFVIDIIRNKYNVPKDIINNTLNSSYMSCYNMFITSKTIFYEYCDFFFDICNEYLKHYNLKDINDVYKHVENNKDKYLKYNAYPVNNVKYQSRIGGFLSERIFNIFIAWKKLNVKEVDVIITEDKYKKQLQNDFI